MSDWLDKTIAINQESNAPKDGHFEQFAPGEILAGKYRVISILGKGGVGTVYKVEQTFLKIELALKVLDGKGAFNDVQVRRFQNEAKATFSLSHPSLVKVHDFGILENDQPYLVMDYVPGKTLAEYIKEHGALSQEMIGKVFPQACFGLAYAHQQSIIHRDIKPNNIMLVDGVNLGAEGSVKIVDFGIAKVGSEEGGEIQTLTKTGEIFGSPLYMSPEQCSGEQIDFRTDVYSLGCTLFHLLTGHPPFRAQQGPSVKEYLEVMRMHLVAPIPDPRADAPNADPELVQAIEGMMTKDRNKRPTFDEIARQLARIAERLGGELPRVTRQLFLVTAESVAGVSDVSADRALKDRAWPRILAFAIIVAAAIALAIALGK